VPFVEFPGFPTKTDGKSDISRVALVALKEFLPLRSRNSGELGEIRMNAQPLAQHIFDVEKRRAARDAVSIRAALHEPGEDSHEILVGNLSPFGFMAISPTAYREGTLVRLNLPLIGEVNARIVWSLSDRIGAEFIRPFDANGYRQKLDSTPHQAHND